MVGEGLKAIFFRQKLREARMPFGGLIVNRAAVLTEAEMTDPVAIDAGLRTELDEPDPIVVPRLDGGVQDIEGLLVLYRHLAASTPAGGSARVPGCRPQPRRSVAAPLPAQAGRVDRL